MGLSYSSATANQPTWADYERNFQQNKGNEAQHREFHDNKTLCDAVKVATQFPDAFWSAIKDRKDIALTGPFLVAVAHGFLQKPEWAHIPITIVAFESFGIDKKPCIESIVSLLGLDINTIANPHPSLNYATCRWSNERALEICEIPNPPPNHHIVKSISDFVFAQVDVKTLALTTNGFTSHIPFPTKLLNLESFYVANKQWNDYRRQECEKLGFRLSASEPLSGFNYPSFHTYAFLPKDNNLAAILLNVGIQHQHQHQEKEKETKNENGKEKEKEKYKDKPNARNDFLSELAQKSREKMISRCMKANPKITLHEEQSYVIVNNKHLYTYVGPAIHTIFIYPHDAHNYNKVQNYAMTYALDVVLAKHYRIQQLVLQPQPRFQHEVKAAWQLHSAEKDLMIVPLSDAKHIPDELVNTPYTWCLSYLQEKWSIVRNGKEVGNAFTKKDVVARIEKELISRK